MAEDAPAEDEAAAPAEEELADTAVADEPALSKNSFVTFSMSSMR